MSLDDFSPDIESSEWWSQSVEVSEKFKEWLKKWAAGIKRTKKDESKAKKHDLLLAGFLVKILIDKKYDPLLEYIFAALNHWFPSNFVLGILSLIHQEIQENIRKFSWKEFSDFTFVSEENIEFDGHHVPHEIRDRMNAWVEDMVDVVSLDHSSIQIRKLRILMWDNSIEKWDLFSPEEEKNIEKSSESIYHLSQIVFTFFLHEANMEITPSKASGITEFIIWEVLKEIKKLEIEEI